MCDVDLDLVGSLLENRETVPPLLETRGSRLGQYAGRVTGRESQQSLVEQVFGEQYGVGAVLFFGRLVAGLPALGLAGPGEARLGDLEEELIVDLEEEVGREPIPGQARVEAGTRTPASASTRSHATQQRNNRFTVTPNPRFRRSV